MGKASRRKKARKQALENKTFIISESILKEAIETINEVRRENINSQESTPQLLNLPENKTDFSACPTCWSTEAHAVLSETIHWAEWECVVCSRHRGWIENPANTAKKESENQLIDQLLQKPGLGTWERMFLQSVKRTRKRSPKQIQKLSEIAARAGFVGGEA
jgi:hypothetical protein